MKIRAKIIAPITLSKDVIEIEFKKRLSVSVDCNVCNRSRRTAVFYENQDKSFCTPTKHNFPGRIKELIVSGKIKNGILSNRSTVTATYCIEYDFEKFVDKKYPNLDVNSDLSWARVTFNIRCTCGVGSEHSAQNNLVRPRKAVCECGKDLFYEIEENPVFQMEKLA